MRCPKLAPPVAAAVIALLSAAGSAAAYPMIAAPTPGGATLREWAGEQGGAAARGIALDYCDARGRRALFGSIERDGSAVIARYRCVAPVDEN